MKLPTSLAVLVTLAMSASAHFTLDYPTSRGFDEDIENDNFCGGFHNVSLPRQPWYYKNGPIEIDSHHDSAIVNIYISFSPPTSAQSFLATSNGTSVPPLRHDLSITGQGEFCFHANASSLNVPGVTVADGTNATIMVENINNVHGHLYQCTDVVFTGDANTGANLTCTDSLTAASPAATGSASSATGASNTGTAAGASSTALPASKTNSAAMASVQSFSVLLLPVVLTAALALA